MSNYPSILRGVENIVPSFEVKTLSGKSVKEIQYGLYKSGFNEADFLWLLGELYKQRRGTQLLYRVHAKYNSLRVKREQKELGGVGYEK